MTINNEEDTVDNESPKILQLRWENALSVANKINGLMDRGFIIMDDEKDVLPYKFTITDNEIYMKFSEHGINGYFTKDVDTDNGYYTPIAQYNRMFEDWTFIEPKLVGSIKDLI